MQYAAPDCWPGQVNLDVPRCLSILPSRRRLLLLLLLRLPLLLFMLLCCLCSCWRLTVRPNSCR